MCELRKRSHRCDDADAWDDDEWRAYRAGLQGLLQEQRAELSSFANRYSPTINAIVDSQLLLPPPAA